MEGGMIAIRSGPEERITGYIEGHSHDNQPGQTRTRYVNTLPHRNGAKYHQRLTRPEPLCQLLRRGIDPLREEFDAPRVQRFSQSCRRISQVPMRCKEGQRSAVHSHGDRLDGPVHFVLVVPMPRLDDVIDQIDERR